MNRHRAGTGIVLKKTGLNEADYLLTLLTEDYGKITCLAKGVKNIKSHRLGSLQIGNVIKYSTYSKNNYSWLSESITIFPFLQTEKSLTQLNLLFYILEIINLFIAEDQNIDGIYPVVEKLIKAISLNRFGDLITQEIALIDTLGFGTPPEIHSAHESNDLPATQKLIKQYLESIIEKPLQSSKLFK
ncbi:DNA repair protein RecO [Candidatus Shapirobacteria bacterium]|nr:DNA repair protein RecO [Candidatus Shapirobacteria bacterium]